MLHAPYWKKRINALCLSDGMNVSFLFVFKVVRQFLVACFVCPFRNVDLRALHNVVLTDKAKLETAFSSCCATWSFLMAANNSDSALCLSDEMNVSFLYVFKVVHQLLVACFVCPFRNVDLRNGSQNWNRMIVVWLHPCLWWAPSMYAKARPASYVFY